MTTTSKKSDQQKRSARKKRIKPARRRSRLGASLRTYASWLGLLLVPLLFWQGTILYVQFKSRELLAERKPKDAYQWVDKVNRFSWHNETNEFLLARSARKMGDFQNFRYHLIRAFELGFDPARLEREEWLAMAQSGDLNKSEPHLSDLLLDPRGDGQEICEAYVIGYLLIQQYAGAEELLKGWADAYPHDPLPWYLRGVVYRDLTQWKSSESAFRRALSIEPDYSDAAFQLGSVLLTLKKTTDAIEFFERASQDPEFHVESRVGQAHCFRLLGKPKQARAVLDEVVLNYPNDPAASLELGRLSLDEANYESAIHWLEPLVRKNPRNTDARYALASALREVDRIEEAQEHFDAVREINEQLADASQLAESIDTQPESADDRLKVAAIHLKYGSESDGLFWMRSGISVNPTHRPTLEAMLDYYTRKAAENPDRPTYGVTAEKFKKMLSELPAEDEKTDKDVAIEETINE